MSSDELNQDELNQDELNKEMLLKIFYSTKGNIDDINAAIDKSLFGTRTRSLTLFEKFVRARLMLNPKLLRLVDMDLTWFEAAYLSQYPGLENVEDLQHFLNLGIDLNKQPQTMSSPYQPTLII